MDELKFSSINELYKRLKPALNAKSHEFKRQGINYIKVEDIWNCLKVNKWSKTTNLELCDMVDNILTLDFSEIDRYIKKSMEKSPRKIITDDNIL